MATAKNRGPVPASAPDEDKRLERLYDYTKFHIGIYLSAAAGLATLLGSKDTGWIISTLIGNQYLLYFAFFLMVLAGMCGGIVATSITQCQTFNEFWSEKEHAPSTLKRWRAKGHSWVAREHGFFWASLIVLTASILIRWPGPPVVPTKSEPVECQCCCKCLPAASNGAATR